MKKRGNAGDVLVTIFVVIFIICIVLFEFGFIYNELLGHDIKITGLFTGDKDKGVEEGHTLITIYAEQEVGRVRGEN